MVKQAPKLYSWKDINSIRKLIDSLKMGSVSATTTDTVTGLLAPLTGQGHARLDKIKGRDLKPYLILTSSRSFIESWIEGEITPTVERLMDHCWPGPLTLIFKARSTIPSYMKGAGGTIAVRIPDHAGLQSVLKEFDGLFSTSANTTGKSVPKTIFDIEPIIIDQLEYLFTDEETASSSPLSSTILDCTQKTIHVVRQGAYLIKDLEKIITFDSA